MLLAFVCVFCPLCTLEYPCVHCVSRLAPDREEAELCVGPRPGSFEFQPAERLRAGGVVGCLRASAARSAPEGRRRECCPRHPVPAAEPRLGWRSLGGAPSVSCAGSGLTGRDGAARLGPEPVLFCPRSPPGQPGALLWALPAACARWPGSTLETGGPGSVRVGKHAGLPMNWGPGAGIRILFKASILSHVRQIPVPRPWLNQCPGRARRSPCPPAVQPSRKAGSHWREPSPVPWQLGPSRRACPQREAPAPPLRQWPWV